MKLHTCVVVLSPDPGDLHIMISNATLVKRRVANVGSRREDLLSE